MSNEYTPTARRPRLPPTFDIAGAVRRLDDLYNTRESTTANDCPLLHNLLKDGTSIPAFPKESAERFLQLVDPDSEEIMYRIIGITERVDLPPIQAKDVDHRDIKYMEQRICIAGAGSSEFARAKTAILFLEQVLAQGVCTQDASLNRNIARDTLTFACRYVHRRAHASEEPIPVERALDPTGRIQDAFDEDDRLIRTEDDEVEYCQVKMEPDISMRRIPPAGIFVGNIVEVTFSIRAYPVKQKKWNLKYTLRGIALLDDTFTLQSMFKSIKTSYNPYITRTKRKFAYADEAAGRKRQQADVLTGQGIPSPEDNIPVDVDADMDACSAQGNAMCNTELSPTHIDDVEVAAMAVDYNTVQMGLLQI